MSHPLACPSRDQALLRCLSRCCSDPARRKKGQQGVALAWGGIERLPSLASFGVARRPQSTSVPQGLDLMDSDASPRRHMADSAECESPPDAARPGAAGAGQGGRGRRASAEGGGTLPPAAREGKKAGRRKSRSPVKQRHSSEPPQGGESIAATAASGRSLTG